MGEEYGGKPGGTPPQQPGGSVPAGSAKPIAEINDALAAMSQLTSQNTQVMQALLQHLNRVSGASKDIGKNFDYAHMELKSLLKDTANLQFSMDRIKKLQAARVSGGAGRQGTVEYVKNLQAEYKILLQVMNTGRGQGRYVKDIEKALDGLDKKLKQVEKQNDRTWDASQIQEINAELERTAKNVRHVATALSSVQVDKMTKGFKDMGRTIDDAFGGQFSQTLQRIPGIAGMMKGFRVAKQAGQAQRDLGELEVRRRVNTQQAMRANAANVYSNHGRAGLNTMRGMGYAGASPRFSPGARKTLVRTNGKWGPAVPGQAPGSGAAAKQGGALDQMTVKAMTVGRLVVGSAGRGGDAPTGPKPLLARDPQTGKWVDKRTGRPYNGPNAPAVGDAPTADTAGPTTRQRFNLSGLRDRFSATAPVEDVQKTMHGSGGMFSRTLNKLVTGMAEKEGGFGSTWAKNRLAQGAGSATAGLAEGALGTGSSLLRGGMGLASRAAVPLAIAGALIQLRDKVAEENKKIEASFAGSGGFGTGGAEDFHSIRKSLLSTGFSNAALLGQNQEKNQKIMDTLTEGGLASGKDLRKGLDLGTALDSQALGPGGTMAGGGFYGSVMKNAVYNGRSVGMGQDASVRLTLKLIEKFGQTTQETQKFFLNLDNMMQHSGVSASKYVEVIDDVLGQFNEMNRSMTNTLGLLNALGKSGRLTGDTLRDVIKGLQAPTQMSTAQRMFNARLMMQGGNADSVAQSLTASNENEQAELARTLATHGVSSDLLGDVAGNRNAIERFLGEKYKNDPTTLKSVLGPLETKLNLIMSQKAQAEALRSGDVGRVAAVVDQGGESGPMAMGVRRTHLQFAAKLVGWDKAKTQRMLGGDQGLLAELMGIPQVSEMFKSNTLMSGESLVKGVQASAQASRSGAGTALGFATANGASSAQLAGTEGKTQDQIDQDKGKFQTMLELQKARIAAGGFGTKKADLEKSDEELVDDFIKAAKENGDKLFNELTALDTTFKLVTTTGSALQKALKENTEAQAEKEKQAQVQALADNTRTTADIFADAFSHLFDKILNMLDSMMKVFKPSDWLKRKEDNSWSDRRAEGIAQIVKNMKLPENATPEQRREFEDLKKLVASGELTTGSAEERNNKTQDAMKRIVALDPSRQSEIGAIWGRENAAAYKKSWVGPMGSMATDANLNTAEGWMATKALRSESAEDTVGALLTKNLEGTGGGDLTKGVLRGNIEGAAFRDIQKTYDADGMHLTSDTAGGRELLETLAKLRSDLVQKTTDDRGNITYHIYSSQHVNSPPPKSETKSGEKPAVTTEQKK